MQGQTKIKFCTDGMLIRDMLEDPLLSSYRYLDMPCFGRNLSQHCLLPAVAATDAAQPLTHLLLPAALAGHRDDDVTLPLSIERGIQREVEC